MESSMSVVAMPKTLKLFRFGGPVTSVTCEVMSTLLVNAVPSVVRRTPICGEVLPLMIETPGMPVTGRTLRPVQSTTVPAVPLKAHAATASSASPKTARTPATRKAPAARRACQRESAFGCSMLTPLLLALVCWFRC